MAESKFLPFQDTDGDLQIDVCKDEKIIVEGEACPEKCIPNESAIVADWATLSEPYLNEKNCKYQIPTSTNYSTTGYEAKMSESDASTALQNIFNSSGSEHFDFEKIFFLCVATVCLLIFNEEAMSGLLEPRITNKIISFSLSVKIFLFSP